MTALRALGWYRELTHGDPDGPSIEVQEVLEPERKVGVLRYLASAPVLAASSMMFRDYFTGEVVAPLNLHTDGTWSWYSDLPHYLVHHDCAIDPDFVAMAVRRGRVALSGKELLDVADSFLGDRVDQKTSSVAEQRFWPDAIATAVVIRQRLQETGCGPTRCLTRGGESR